MDLGIEQTDTGLPAATVVERSSAPRIRYPSLSLDDTKAKEFLAATPSELGDTITATVKLKISGLREDQYGSSVTFDVLSLDTGKADKPGSEATPFAGKEPPAEEAAEVEEEDESEAKLLGYKRPKTKKEAPALKAEDLLS